MVVAATLLISSPSASESIEWRRVERVIDGDTLLLKGGERVRLIGVDTPETVHPQKPVERFGKEATAFTRSRAEGKRVRLEFESGQTKDRYGRTVGRPYVGELDVRKEMVRAGAAWVYRQYVGQTATGTQ